MTNVHVFRPRSSIFFSLVAYLLILGSALQSVLTDGASAIVLNFVICMTIALFIYAVIQRPRLEIADEGVRIINPISTTYLNWSEVIGIETRFVLTFQTGTKSIGSWAALAPNRYHHRNIFPSEIRGILDENHGSIRASDSPRTDSGAAAFLARQRWQAYESPNGI